MKTKTKILPYEKAIKEIASRSRSCVIPGAFSMYNDMGYWVSMFYGVPEHIVYADTEAAFNAMKKRRT